MSKVIEGLYYSKDHEWVKVEGDVATVGITDHAQSEMGDVVFVNGAAVGDTVSAGDAVSEVESVKAASDIITPVSGTITAANEELDSAPEKLNADPYANWLFTIELSDKSELEDLMDAAAYAKFCNQ